MTPLLDRATRLPTPPPQGGREQTELAARQATGGASLALRYAARELRGGLRGFYVFVACIALGVMAIAGVGSVASGLADGLAREGRVILGGDVAFSLSLREASPEERAFIDGRGRMSVAATMRAMARTPDGRTALVELKAVDAAYPLYGTVRPSRRSRSPRCWRSATARSAPPPIRRCWRGSISRRARASRSAQATIEIRATLASEPDKLAGGIGFGPRLLISEAALRATGLLQPGSVVRWHYRLRLPDNDATDTAVRAVTAAASAQLPEAGWEVRSRANASPALERNVERFTQYLTLVGLTALLVGGVGVANAVKGHLDRRRDVIATLKSLGATGSGVFTIYLTQVMVLAALGALPGPGGRRRHAVPDRLGLRRGAAAAARARPASGRPRAGAALRAADRRRLRAVAARTRARRAGLAAVSRRGRERAPLAAPALRGGGRAGRLRAGDAGGQARLRPAHRRDLRGRRRRGVRAAAAGRRAADGNRPPPAAAALAGGPARHRQYPPAGCADAERGAVAGPGPGAAGHGDRDRRQSAPAVPGGAARQGAGVLLRRYRGGRGRKIRRLHSRAGAARDARAGADAARTYRIGERDRGRADQAAARHRLGAAERSRHHLRGQRRRPARAWSQANGGRATIRARRWSRSRSGSPTGSASRSATR